MLSKFQLLGHPSSAGYRFYLVSLPSVKSGIFGYSTKLCVSIALVYFAGRTRLEIKESLVGLATHVSYMS